MPEEHSLLYSLINPLLVKLFHLPEDASVIPEHILMAMVVVVGCLILFPLIRRRLRPTNPGYFQQTLELGVEWLLRLLTSNIGPKGRKYLPLIGTLGIFILFANLLGIVPGFLPPTSNINTTVGLALVSFCYYNMMGVREKGLINYMKQFGGAVWWLSPLIFPIEVISHLARPLSLSIRLFGNIFGDHILIMVFFALFPLLVPLPMICLSLFVAGIQTYIFVLLSTIYIAGAVAAEEH